MQQEKVINNKVADASSKHWVYLLLPSKIWPYAQLARWDRPVGWQLLLWPCWWGTVLAFFHLQHYESDFSVLSVESLFWYLFLFFVGAIVMRGAGCTYNDLVDHQIDKAVQRTSSRPLPSKRVGRKQAKIFLIIQSLVGLLILVQFNLLTIILGFCSLTVVFIYPFMKYITDWPQFFLGLAFSWGALVGWSAVFSGLNSASIFLYLSAVFWTIGYDTIYGHQDKKDDVLIGVRSTARLFGSKTKQALFTLYSMMFICMSISFWIVSIPRVLIVTLCLANTAMFWQIAKLNFDIPDECSKFFKLNSLFGFSIFLLLLTSLGMKCSSQLLDICKTAYHFFALT